MPRNFALVPAAGTGVRVGGDEPKQYRLLAGQPMLRHALDTLCASPRIARVFVILAGTDAVWERFDWSGLGAKLVVLRCGGATRAESVANGLSAISEMARADDWILVHDAARPCLSPAQLDALIDQVGDDAVGGLLAAPVADTLKRAASDRRVEATVPREHLWQAQTPQMFRHGLLREALVRGGNVTDEASAVEALGQRPLLVAADASNLKVTWPSDLMLAETILRERRKDT
ncbi:MAG: 2-C-methyl-D-erythritol 4-phosphate cytidylyltransferase [Zoogloeaceae bacterium]|jgi:2-C-methyl-D-erythritol 4-phosphate cytidylyltransferase|nr:2-C-methyl-D-erythritol 4-phosphate cytidylyltransferase [Zoogloeaceae bacterium]